MDPAACLRDALEAMTEGEKSEAFSHLSDYWNWRELGGFQPAGGDDRANEVARLSLTTAFTPARMS